MDKFNFGSGSETFVMVEYEKAASLSAMTNGQFFKIADAGSGQPLDFDVRFVKSDKAKLAYFMPPPQLSLADGATVQIDGVNIVSRSGNNVTSIILLYRVFGILKMLNRSQEPFKFRIIIFTIMIFQLAQVKIIRSC